MSESRDYQRPGARGFRRKSFAWSGALALDERDLLSARGTEKRISHKPGKPHAGLSNRSLSEPAKLLRDYYKGDDNALIRLHEHLVEQIMRIDKPEGWRVCGRYYELAALVLYPWRYGRQPKSKEGAELMKITPQSFNANWMPKIKNRCQIWVKGWDAELGIQPRKDLV